MTNPSIPPAAYDGKKSMQPNEPQKRDSRVFWIVAAVLLVLVLLTAVLLAARLIDYIHADERVLLLTTNADETLEVFQIQYHTADGEVTVMGSNGESVVAPGTRMEYTIRLKNNDSVAIDYELIPDVVFTSEHALPILVCLKGDDGSYLVGSEDTLAEITALNQLCDRATLGVGESVEYLFCWEWPFESGDDGYDTFLGDHTLNEQIGISVSFGTHAVANTTIPANGGWLQSGAVHSLLLLILLILLLVALTILIVRIVKERQNEKAQEGEPIHDYTTPME